MSATLSTLIELHLRATLQNPVDLSTPQDPLDLNEVLANMASGTSTNQANLSFHDTRSLNAESSETLDLTGSLVDALGRTLTFTAIKAIFIRAKAANTLTIEIGNAASNPFKGPFYADDGEVEPTERPVITRLAPGQAMLLTAPASGWPVSGADQLKVNNPSAGASSTYDIVIIGTGTVS